MREIRTVDIVTHRRPEETAAALGELIACVRDTGVTLRVGPGEAGKHPELVGQDGVETFDHPVRPKADLCITLGGDGTILTALRDYAGTGVPVFGVNFGEMGFLTAVDRDATGEGFRLALRGEFEVVSLPGIEVTGARGRWVAINDISMHRQQGKRVADLEYFVGADAVGRVRCDGLVVATPVGSTGYNLANGGPVMAWGVHGFVVSFIAPHSFTARTLVVARDDGVSVVNRSKEEPVDVTVDGRPVSTLEASETLSTRFVADQGTLAQIPGTTFYERLRQRFGRVAAPI